MGLCLYIGIQIQITEKFLPLPRFEPGTSPVTSWYATNWAILAFDIQMVTVVRLFEIRALNINYLLSCVRLTSLDLSARICSICCKVDDSNPANDLALRWPVANRVLSFHFSIVMLRYDVIEECCSFNSSSYCFSFIFLAGTWNKCHGQNAKQSTWSGLSELVGVK